MSQAVPKSIGVKLGWALSIGPSVLSHRARPYLLRGYRSPQPKVRTRAGLQYYQGTCSRVSRDSRGRRGSRGSRAAVGCPRFRLTAPIFIAGELTMSTDRWGPTWRYENMWRNIRHEAAMGGNLRQWRLARRMLPRLWSTALAIRRCDSIRSTACEQQRHVRSAYWVW